METANPSEMLLTTYYYYYYYLPTNYTYPK